MQAFRNVGGNVVEITVDTDANGNPLLPKDTTVDARPEPQAGHYVTVVGNAWVQIPYPQEFKTFEYQKQLALEKLSAYKKWYLDQPVTHLGQNFDADELSKNRLVQAVTVFNATTYLPPAWIDADNIPFPITTIADITGIITSVSVAFATKFFEMVTLRAQITAAADETALNAITIPQIPSII